MWGRRAALVILLGLVYFGFAHLFTEPATRELFNEYTGYSGSKNKLNECYWFNGVSPT